jgi:leukotriene-A4 hydrolase
MAGNLTGTYQAFYGYYKSCFYNQVPTANFMMSAIVGKLEKRDGMTVGGIPVYLIAEPGIIDSAVNEFSALQPALNTIENYFGTPYLWGSYTLAIMPPAFPMSGMAAPNLCYAHVSTIVGDGSQEYVIIRGGVAMLIQAIVTAIKWEDQWLNYGLSTYVERFVEPQFYSFDFAQTEAFIGNVSMVREHNVYGAQNQTYSSLHPVLRGANPDDAFNIVAFEKGFQLLYYIEANVTDFASVQDFFQFYIEYNNLMSICAFQYRHTYSAFVSQYYANDDIVNQILSEIDYEQWIYEVGVEPTGMFSFSNSQTDAAISLADAFVALNGASSPANANDYLGWPSNQQVVFVQSLLWNTACNSAIMTQVDASLNITGTMDPEIKERWFALGLYVNYAPVNAPCEAFVGSTGRNKYLQTIYNACAEVGGTAYTNCVTWYNNNINFYTPLTKALVSNILNI